MILDAYRNLVSPIYSSRPYLNLRDTPTLVTFLNKNDFTFVFELKSLEEVATVTNGST